MRDPEFCVRLSFLAVAAVTAACVPPAIPATLDSWTIA
jgi:hypothetical protein